MENTAFNQLKASPSIQWLLKHTGIGPLRTYIRWFGLVGAFKILWNKWLSIDALVSVRNPHLKAPVFLRATDSDPYIYAEVLHDRAYAFGLPATAQFIVDAGANIGLSSVFFANHYPEATIVAIEPSESNMSLLRKNTAAYSHVHPRLAALWSSAGPLRLVNPDGESWAIQVEPCQPSEADFLGLTVPGIMAEYSVKQIDVLKIDIEGAEWPLLFDAAPDWLRSVNFLVMELHSQQGRGPFDQVTRLVEQYGLRHLNTVGNNYVFSR